ncbi:structural toxin protein (hemagglutinin/hemolysin) RtxA [Psychromonas marina]|uniref:Structural toxin protein (Hemagglutinin/hemolysin) RtxA n=1 Tax=Psychromonas marina TaxID=88364 RepID=A0ABQ6DW22_9GAMM|nr:NGG1p interacting factor NIF3 [Psychromonas marina]GLS89317.1 structural toxin protein (hemagglutinin/hemolysin) RtxA [Psychromonas marina]
MYQLIFYVPEAHCEMVKSALFDAGAGKVGNYDHCAWQVLGTGQFRPLKNSDAFIGEVDKLEKLAEFRVEMVCEKQQIKSVLTALIDSHPYQTPAYSVIDIKTLDDF